MIAFSLLLVGCPLLGERCIHSSHLVVDLLTAKDPAKTQATLLQSGNRYAVYVGVSRRNTSVMSIIKGGPRQAATHIGRGSLIMVGVKVNKLHTYTPIQATGGDDMSAPKSPSSHPHI